VYRELGRLPLVEKLLRIELSAASAPRERAPLLRELGDVLMDLGRLGEAAASYAEAVAGGEPAAFLLEDAQVAAEEWPVQVGRLLQQAEASGDRAEKAETLLRAAGIAGAFSEPDKGQLLLRAYEADPLHDRVTALFEGQYVETDHTEELAVIQSRLLEACRDTGDRGELAFRFGARWAQRHNARLAVPLLLSALRVNVDYQPAVTYLYEASKTDSSLDEVLVGLAEELSDRFSSDMGPGLKAGGGLSYLLASAALVAARDLNNINSARLLGERLSQVDPSHPALGQLALRLDEIGH
jgi:tetratricopeptide (TPR) repeat protein